jgi:murein DD-endopeptidase MepM/ murein hydrolase activator NlpD
VHTGITRLLNHGLRLTAICVGLICTSAFAVELSGTAMQGQVIFGQTSPGAKVSLDDRAVMVSPEGQFVIGFGRDQTGSQTLAISLPSGGSETHVLDIAPREYNIERVDGLPPSTVTPDPSALDRIRQEAKMVASARERRDERTDFAQGFDWPARGRISGVYGSQRVLNGEPRRPHFGLDIAAPEGSPVYAPAPGIITLTHPDMYFSGGTIILDHAHGLSSTFLHLSEVLVEAGTRVDKGLLMGRVGSTGRASGPHLDWRMNWLDKRVDPQQLVSGLPVAGKD